MDRCVMTHRKNPHWWINLKEVMASLVTQQQLHVSTKVRKEEDDCRTDCSCGHVDEKCVIHALRTAASNFLLAYNLRAGIGIVARALSLLRTKPGSIFNLEELLGENGVRFRVDAVRTALFMSTCTGLFEATSCALRKGACVGGDLNSLISGCMSGLSIVFMDAERRRTLSLYAFVRALQCLYNTAKLRGWWHLWGSHWGHGDSLLFAVTSAQVMYAYVMRPHTLPRSYNAFIMSTGPVAPRVLEAVRATNRGLPVDTAALSKWWNKHAPGKAGEKMLSVVNDAHMPQVPCSLFHLRWPGAAPACNPSTTGACTANAGMVALRVFQKTWALYISLNIVPLVVLRFKRFLRSPLQVALRALLSATRSTAFLAAFVAGYQALICTQRRTFKADHKLWYYVAGMLCSSSVLLEQKSRRSELALYVLPRAFDSLFMILQERRWLQGLSYGELVLFVPAMAVLMRSFQKEPGDEEETMSPWLRKVMANFFPLHGVLPATSPLAPAPVISPKASTPVVGMLRCTSCGNVSDHFLDHQAPEEGVGAGARRGDGSVATAAETSNTDDTGDKRRAVEGGTGATTQHGSDARGVVEL